MKTLILAVFAALLFSIAIATHAQNIEGQIIASQYGTWKVPGYAADTYSDFAPTACRVQGGASFFSPFSVGTPISIVDSDPNLTEIVTPVEVVENNNACSISISPAHHHGLPFSMTSATGGLQEAINANLSNPGTNTIILNNEWYQLGGSTATIASVKGSAQLGLVDVTTTPFTWYQWNGSAYVKNSVTGVPSVNGSAAAITLTSGSGVTISTTGGTNTIFNTGLLGLNGMAGDVSLAAGSNIVIAPSGNTLTISASGSAGSGSVQPCNQYSYGSYPNTGSSATVGCTPNKSVIPMGQSSAQLTSLFGAAAAGNYTIQDGDGHNQWLNPHFVGVDDEREDVPVADWNVKWSGAQCDLQGGFGSVTAGSPTLTFTAGYTATAADAGDPTTHAGAKSIEIVGTDPVTGIPDRFDATITGYTNSTTVTLSTNAPFTVSEYGVLVGHRDDAAIVAAFDNFSYRRPIAFPTGNCWSDTIAVWGQSFHGNGRNASLISGLAGDDVFASLDPSKAGYTSNSPDMQIHDMKWEINPLINAAQPWEDTGSTGTVTQHAATYRPVGIFTVWANYPLGPGWIAGTGPNSTGAFNGVATTNGTTSIMVTSATVPAIGQQIVFPYTSAGVFVTTVSGVSGSTVTLATTYPVSGTQTQQEWMAGAAPSSVTSGTAVQAIETAIPASTARTASITAYSITSNVITFTAANGYSAGQLVNISTFGTSTFLNGAQLTVLSIGLSGSQFEAAFTHANASATESGSASIFPFLITLANPITPPLTYNVAGTGSNVAPYGLVQIGSEHFSYFGNSDYPAETNSMPSITLTAGAQNGTAAVPHAVSAAIVPLNPFQPTWPWPVTPSINAGVTPADASYFPAWNIGNAAWAQPIYNGVDWNSNAALFFSNMHDITMTLDDFYSGSGNPSECYQGCQLQNATAGMYIVPLPYKTNFENIHIENPQFGIFEGTPSINTYGMFGGSYPTADGSTWKNITIQSAAFDTLFIGGQSDTKRDFLTFCQNLGETGNSWPGIALTQFGCGAAWIWGGTYDDKDEGGGSDSSHATLENWYVEAETGSQQHMQPYFEFNCGQCTYRINPFSGGESFIEGANNDFTGMQVLNSPSLPIVNYASGTNMQWVTGASASYPSNTYGQGVFLNYGPNASVMGQTDGNAGPWGNLVYGNSLAPVAGQTGEAFETGNETAAYVSSSSAMIYPDQFNASTQIEAYPMSVGWTFDPTAPISQSYAACNTTSSTGCNTHEFNSGGTAGGVYVGPGQKIAAGKYIAHYALRTVNGANTLNLQFAAGTTVYDANVTTSSTWTQYTTAPIDFSASSGNSLNVWFNGTTTTDQVQIAYLVFTPVWANVVLPVTTPTEGASCPTPGAILGSDASYIYICASGGTIKRVGIS